MTIGSKVSFTVVAQRSFSGVSLLSKEQVGFEKTNFPVLAKDSYYKIKVNPYSLGNNDITYDTATVKVVCLTYNEAEDCYELICTAGVSDYVALSKTYHQQNI